MNKINIKMFDIILNKILKENFTDSGAKYSLENGVFTQSDMHEKSLKKEAFALNNSILIFNKITAYGEVTNQTDFSKGFVQIIEKTIEKFDYKKGIQIQNDTGLLYHLSNETPVVVKGAFELFYNENNFILSNIISMSISYIKINPII